VVEDAFFSDFCPSAHWLETALANHRAGKQVRITFVTMDSGPNTKHKMVIRGGDFGDLCMRVTGPGDITKESFYPKE